MAVTTQTQEAGEKEGGLLEWSKRVRALNEELGRELVKLARRRLGRGWLFDAQMELDANYVPVRRDMELMAPWAMFQRLSGGGTMCEHLARWLPEVLKTDAQRSCLAAQTAAWISYWEVTAVHPERGVEVRDLLSGETRTVVELRGTRPGTKALEPGHLLLARVVDFEGRSLFLGVYPRALQAKHPAAQLLISVALECYAPDGARIPQGLLRGSDLGLALINSFRLALGLRREDRPMPPSYEEEKGPWETTRH